MEIADAWPGRLLSTSRGQVFVRRFDGGIGLDAPGRPPILFVHGLGGESLDWVDVAVQLKDSFDCSALDLPGFAHSPLPPGKDLSLDGLAGTVAEVARTFGGPVHLVGVSLGGAIAVRVSAERPELVASLTLVAPALPNLGPKPGSAQLLIALAPVVGPAIVRTIIKADPEWMAKRIYALCYGNPRAVSPGRHARELATLRQRASLEYSPYVYREALRTTVMSYLDRGPRRLWQQAALVAVPTLVISGGRDRLVSRRVAARAKRAFQDVELLLLPKAGHVAHLEDPTAVAAAMRGFLSRPDLTRGMPERRGTVVEVGPTTPPPVVSPHG
ncbi:MAG TPA: alpha/beta hydrolase [Acidothermaceae bacterium]|nr:alpha/beta hydrolase [Acidothermaceae bacterium]